MNIPVVTWRCQKCRKEYFSGYYTREHKPTCHCDWGGGDCKVTDVNFKPDKEDWKKLEGIGGTIQFEKDCAWKFSKYVIEEMHKVDEEMPF